MKRALVAAAICGALAAGASAAAPSSLTFRRADGSAIAFTGKTYVWCGRWEPDVAEPAVHALLVPPRRRRSSYWLLSGVLRDVRKQPRVGFPIGFAWNKPRGGQLFVYDARTKNEASSETEEARGTIVFSKLTCAKGSAVQIDVSGVLGSEFSDGKPVRVSGTFRGVVGRPPPGLG